MKFKNLAKIFRRKRILILLIILSVSFINILNIFLHHLPEHPSSTTMQKNTNLLTKQSIFKITTTTKHFFRSIKSSLVINITYYRLVPQRRYEYEYRFEYNTSHNEDHPRVMVLYSGSTRTCADYWNFAVGRRILARFRQYGYFILAICTRRKNFDSNSPLINNTDVRLAYTTMQKWIHEVFYEHFRQYPRLYIHTVSRGGKFAAILSRLLPIQGQIFTIYPGHYGMMETISSHSIHLQNRLTDPVFANWFHFEYCYRNAFEINKTKSICPYGDLRQKFYQPVTPTFFVHAKNDRYFSEKDYTNLIDLLRKRAYRLGGPIFNHSQSLQFIMLQPLNVSPRFFQKFYPFWYSKPYAASFFYEHFINKQLYRPINRSVRTCKCLKIDFLYFEHYSNLTQNWSQKKREQYRDYTNDILNNRVTLCEDLCGDIYAHHAMISRELNKALDWLNQMDSIRKQSNFNELIQRPLRIYMYDKFSLYPNNSFFSFNNFNWMNLIKSYRMYAPEYFLQEYFRQKRNTSHQKFQLISDPLLADYYFIPNDLMYFYCYSIPINMTQIQFKRLYIKLNFQYFKPMLDKIQKQFPFWKIAKRENLMGSNHIIALVNGRNMGFLDKTIQIDLKNVIQLVFTGIRQDLLPIDAPSPYTYKGLNITYRHGYDIILPPFTPIKHNESQIININLLLKKKKRLFFFAGELSHSMSQQSARSLLSLLRTEIKSKEISFQEKQYDQFTVFEGHMKPNEYIEAIESSVFSICPEGFLPWSPRLQEAIQIGAIPMILSDNIVLPFERYIPWRLISAKLNISQIRNLTNFIYQISNFDQYVERKLRTASQYINAFQWPYKILHENQTNPTFVFSPNQNLNGAMPDVFSYLSLELQCRAIEQFYGLTHDSFSLESKRAQHLACIYRSTICPCHPEQQSVAFQQYI